MADTSKYRIHPGAKAVEVEDEDVQYQGAPLTAERIEEIVEHVDRATNLIPGGKSLSGGSKHSPVVRVRLPEDTRDEVEHRAREKGVSVSKYLRELITSSLH